MTAAFDTIDRQKLLDITERLVDEDENRLIRYLLSDTTMELKTQDTNLTEKFSTNIGTPQGDGLSPILFIIYLENALKDVRKEIQTKEMTPSEVCYADDCDFITCSNYVDVDKIEPVLGRHDLNANKDKTEYTLIKRETEKIKEKWRNSKKVGSLLGDTEDVNRRKILASAALNKKNKIWKQKKYIKRNTKIKIYRSMIKSVLTYNCGTWGLTKAEWNKLDAFHRKQLKYILNITWPTRISNEKLDEIFMKNPYPKHAEDLDGIY